MRSIDAFTFENAVDLAQKAVEKSYPGTHRIWTCSKLAAAYSKPTTLIFGLEGTPPKGYVLAATDCGFVLAVSVTGEPLGRWFFGDQPEMPGAL